MDCQCKMLRSVCGVGATRITGPIYVPKCPSQRSVKGATMNGVTYEGVAEFIYLGTLTSNDDSVEKET